VGNGIHGVAISLEASDNSIGGQGSNTIAFNGNDGVWIGSGTGNRVLRNSIHSNGGLGIDLGTDGVTPNDPGDEDGSPNMLQNFPVLDAALVGGGATAVFGTLESEADTDYRLHFWHNASCDPSGNGEGETYLGSRSVSTDTDGLASFRLTFAQIAQNRHVTGVAVDPQGNTSEFSACEQTTVRPTLAIDDVTVTEGNSGTTAAVFTVTRSGNTGGTSTVNFATANGTAVAPGDYTTASGTVTFASGETTKTITVNVVGDALDEPTETFRVNLSVPVDATITDNQGVGTITDDDPSPTISIDDPSVLEVDSGATSKITFTVSLSGGSGQTVTVNYATANGTAVAPGDYTAKSGSLSFSPGTLTQTIVITVRGDVAVEGNEHFFVNLSGATHATISDSQGQGTIQDDAGG
jgi:urease beta subunit